MRGRKCQGKEKKSQERKSKGGKYGSEKNGKKEEEEEGLVRMDKAKGKEGKEQK